MAQGKHAVLEQQGEKTAWRAGLIMPVSQHNKTTVRIGWRLETLKSDASSGPITAQPNEHQPGCRVYLWSAGHLQIQTDWYKRKRPKKKNQFHCQSGHLIAEFQEVMNKVCGPDYAGCIPLTLLFEGLSDCSPLPEAPSLSQWRSTLKRGICVPNWLPDIDTLWVTLLCYFSMAAGKPSLSVASPLPALVICLPPLLCCFLVIWTSVKVVCLQPCGVIRLPVPNLVREMWVEASLGSKDRATAWLLHIYQV